jgi:hypothetical protein
MEVSGQLQAPTALPPRKETTVPTEYEAGWASEPVWTLWRRENYLALAGNRTPVVQPVARRHTELGGDKTCIRTFDRKT